MPIVNLDAQAVETMPEVKVYASGTLSGTIICEEISIGRDGATARFRLDGSAGADYNVLPIVQSELVVKIDDVVRFAGWVDQPQSALRGERVVLLARSPLSWLRERSVNVRSAITGDAAVGIEQRLMQWDEKRDVANILQPSQVVEYFASLSLDAFWAARINFVFDPLIPPTAAVPQTLTRVEYDATTNAPKLAEYVKQVSPWGDQIFRMATWGQVLDYLCELVPGVQVFEEFGTSTATATASIVLSYAGRAGSMIARAGLYGYDWRTIGANVRELDVVTGGGDTANRAIGYGAPVACTITLMSESYNDDEVELLGLVPDWPVFDLSNDTPVTPAEMVGCCAYDYDLGVYVLASPWTQTLPAIIASAPAGTTGPPEDKPGLEFVGRRWRLPNWLAGAAIANKDFFIDSASGNGIGYQVFVEKPVRYDSSGNYRYAWMLEPDADFDPATLTLTLKNLEWSFGLKVSGELTVLDESIRKLCRVALTLTVEHPSKTLCVDSYLDAGSVITPAYATAITTGIPFVFQRDDLKQHQLSNIDYPFVRSVRERVIQSPVVAAGTGSCISREPMDTPDGITYDRFIMYAARGGADEILAYVDDTVPSDWHWIEDEKFAAARMVRDDYPTLATVVRNMLYTRCRRPRAFDVTFTHYYGDMRRGMALGIENLDNMAYDRDIVDTVRHDLTDGTTRITTTNMPSGSTVTAITSGRVALG